MNQSNRLWFFWIPVLALCAIATAQEQGDAKTGKAANQVPIVVFVCEHGSAKSVVAAAHFNKLARERNLELRAVSRGTHPDKGIAPNVAKGLQSDGFAVGRDKPKRLSKADVAGAVRIVTFCQLPKVYSNAAHVEQWNDVPPLSDDYNKARDAIVEHIRHLLDELRSP